MENLTDRERVAASWKYWGSRNGERHIIYSHVTVASGYQSLLGLNPVLRVLLDSFPIKVPSRRTGEFALSAAPSRDDEVVELDLLAYA